MNKNIFSVIKKKYMETSPQTWWGDSIDCRFHLIKRVKSLKNQKILDIGSNTGIIMSELDESNNIYGFDYNHDFIKECYKISPRSKVFQADMFNIPLLNDSFNSVILAGMLDVPKSFVEKRKLLEEVHRILVPNGTVFIMTFSQQHWCYQRNKTRVNLKQLQQLLEPFFEYKIYGWNPIPPFLFFIPPSLVAWIPHSLWKYLDIPSPILAKVPGMYNYLKWLSNKKALLKISKSFYVEAVKK